MKPLVGIIMGSSSDWETMRAAAEALDKFGVPYEDALRLYRKAATLPGLRVVGIDVHIGSQIVELAPFVSAHGIVQPAFSPTSGITILGGLYVMVRGLDNIGTGLKGSTWEPRWRRLSGERDKKDSIRAAA